MKEVGEVIRCDLFKHATLFSTQIKVNRGLSKSNHGNHFLSIPEIWSINESREREDDAICSMRIYGTGAGSRQSANNCPVARGSAPDQIIFLDTIISVCLKVGK